MKFVLILQICSALSGTCETAQKASVQFGTFYECGIGGYSIAGSTIKQMDQKLVNKEKLYIKFGCLERQDEIS